MVRLEKECCVGNTSFQVFSLQNKNGMKLVASTFGARAMDLYVKDQNGKLVDVLLGYKTPEEYIEKPAVYGATIGRYGNRIGGAKFTLNGTTYTLDQNDHGNMLHGGLANYAYKVFDAKILGEDSLQFSYVSKDMEGGFPGNLTLTVTYTLTEENEWVITYEATTDKDTVCNFTNHAYFNLGYEDTILNEVMEIKASKMTRVRDDLIPTGEIVSVLNTPYDFTKPKTIGKDCFSCDHLIHLCNGFDFNYVLDKTNEKGLEQVMTVTDPSSGITMDCLTTMPGGQLYTSNHMDFIGKRHYPDHAAFCFETQGFPDSPNHENFPSTTLLAGVTLKEQTIYKFH